MNGGPSFRCDAVTLGEGPCGAEAVRFYSPPAPHFRARCQEHLLDTDSLTSWEEISYGEAVILSVMTR